jgi:hypothetical protein
VQTAAWACTQRMERGESSATHVAQTSAAGDSAIASSQSAREEGPERHTTRSRMLSHYADTAAMRQALVAGSLPDYQSAAAVVARDDWSPSSATHVRELTVRARGAATAAQAAPSLVAAASALGELGDVCSSCHLASGTPQILIAPEEPINASDPVMVDHSIASNRLWAGLTLPSDDSWFSGARLLEHDPGLAAPSAEVSAAARQLRELARRAELAEPDQRGLVFANVLLTCFGCHERLGVVIESGIAD